MLDDSAYKTYSQIAGEVRRQLEISFIYHTNRLECSYLPQYATRKLLTASKGVTNCKRKKHFRSKDILLVSNQFGAISYVRKLASLKDYKITEADIKRIHAIIAERLISNPGEYRQDNLKEEIQSLVNFMNNRLEPIEHSTRVLHKFSTIQPFPNYNGLVARLLWNYILLRNRYLLSIIDSDKRSQYLDCLSNANSTPLLQFLTMSVLRTERAYHFRIKDKLMEPYLSNRLEAYCVNTEPSRYTRHS